MYNDRHVFLPRYPVAIAKHKTVIQEMKSILGACVRHYVAECHLFSLSESAVSEPVGWSNKVNIYPFIWDQGTCSVVFPYPALYDRVQLRGQAQT